MIRFIESIRLLNGTVENVKYHQARINETFAFYFEGKAPISLQQIIDSNQPPENGLFKLRIVYAETLEKIEYLPYQAPFFRKFQCFRIPDDFIYRFKFANRIFFENISKKIEPDVLPVLIQKGLVTDSTFTNLVFKRGDKWFTPKTPLLQGVQLQIMTETFPVNKVEIRETEIETFDAIYPINALNTPGTIAPVSTG